MTYDDLNTDAIRAPGCLCSAPRGRDSRYVEVTLHEDDLEGRVVELHVNSERITCGAWSCKARESTLLWGEVVGGA